MAKIRFILRLDQVGNPGNAARLWLDTTRDDLIQPGQEEVTLSTVDGRVWLGNKTVADPTTNMLFYVKFIAPIGTGWSFVAETPQGKLHETKDQTTTTQIEGLAGRLQ